MPRLTKIDMCNSLSDLANVNITLNNSTCFACFFESKDSKKFAFIENYGSSIRVRFCSVDDEYVKTALNFNTFKNAVAIVREFFEGADISAIFDTYFIFFDRKTKVKVDYYLENFLFSYLGNSIKFVYDPFDRIFKVFLFKKNKSKFAFIERCTHNNFRILVCDTKLKIINCVVRKGIDDTIRAVFVQLI